MQTDYTEAYILTKETARLLAVSVDAVKRLRRREIDPLPSHRISDRRVRFLASEVEAWRTRQSGVAK